MSQVALDVPQDARVLDLVFSDSGSEGSGFYDNNGGLDYHVPVEGGTGSPLQLHVVHVTVEMAPIAKVRWEWVLGADESAGVVAEGGVV